LRRHVADEARRQPVSALVYIGDAMEEETSTSWLWSPVSCIAESGHVLLFHEGHDPAAASVFAK